MSLPSFALSLGQGSTNVFFLKFDENFNHWFLSLKWNSSFLFIILRNSHVLEKSGSRKKAQNRARYSKMTEFWQKFWPLTCTFLLEMKDIIVVYHSVEATCPVKISWQVGPKPKKILVTHSVETAWPGKICYQFQFNSFNWFSYWQFWSFYLIQLVHLIQLVKVHLISTISTHSNVYSA